MTVNETWSRLFPICHKFFLSANFIYLFTFRGGKIYPLQGLIHEVHVPDHQLFNSYLWGVFPGYYCFYGKKKSYLWQEGQRTMQNFKPKTLPFSARLFVAKKKWALWFKKWRVLKIMHMLMLWNTSGIRSITYAKAYELRLLKNAQKVFLISNNIWRDIYCVLKSTMERY